MPFPRFMRRADLRALLGGGLYLEPTTELEAALADVIDRLWTGEVDCDDARRRAGGAARELADAAVRARLVPKSSDCARPSAGPRRSTSTPTWTRRRSTWRASANVCVGVREPDGPQHPVRARTTSCIASATTASCPLPRRRSSILGVGARGRRRGGRDRACRGWGAGSQRSSAASCAGNSLRRRKTSLRMIRSGDALVRAAVALQRRRPTSRLDAQAGEAGEPGVAGAVAVAGARLGPVRMNCRAGRAGGAVERRRPSSRSACRVRAACRSRERLSSPRRPSCPEPVVLEHQACRSARRAGAPLNPRCGRSREHCRCRRRRSFRRRLLAPSLRSGRSAGAGRRRAGGSAGGPAVGAGDVGDVDDEIVEVAVVLYTPRALPAGWRRSGGPRTRGSSRADPRRTCRERRHPRRARRGLVVQLGLRVLGLRTDRSLSADRREADLAAVPVRVVADAGGERGEGSAQLCWGACVVMREASGQKSLSWQRSRWAARA